MRAYRCPVNNVTFYISKADGFLYYTTVNNENIRYLNIKKLKGNYEGVNPSIITAIKFLKRSEIINFKGDL